MNEFLRRSLPHRSDLIFSGVFASTFAVLAGVLITVVVVWLPKVYSSTVRIAIEKGNRPTAEVIGDGELDPYYIQTEFEKITSRDVLTTVIEDLDLTRWLGSQTGAASRLAPEEAFRLLRNMVDVRQTRNTSLLEVRVCSEDRLGAAEIANKIVEVYQRNKASAKAPGRVEIVDPAEPGLRPIRPNLLLSLSVGLPTSGVASLIVALLVRLILARRWSAS
jgi:uncharacterized protein involved in exopolysaccharide biosynthesis